MEIIFWRRIREVTVHYPGVQDAHPFKAAVLPAEIGTGCEVPIEFGYAG